MRYFYFMYFVCIGDPQGDHDLQVKNRCSIRLHIMYENENANCNYYIKLPITLYHNN